jgi:hypothetical protein
VNDGVLGRNYSANTTGANSIAWTGNSVVITSTTNYGDLDYWWQAQGATDWNHERVASNPSWPRDGAVNRELVDEIYEANV